QQILNKSEVRSLSLTAVHDSRFPFLKPFRGVYTSFGVENAGLVFGGATFAKYTGEIRKYFIVKKGKEGNPDEAKLPKHWVYATRLMAGGSSGVPPFLDQFQMGGADTLRGYKDDRFPGETMVLWNHELRIPITEALDVVGFFDTGDAWGGRFADALGDSRFKLRYGYGGGIRVQTPIGPLRLDYGINDEGGSEFTFGVGPTF
ncbi:MAG TPA: BamA/TamA family outer membrane protein, partial [Armatimonadota bacterium]